jgi:hypothetical protein
MQMVCEAVVKLRPHTDREILPTGRSIQSSRAKDFKLTKLKFEKGQKWLIIAKIGSVRLYSIRYVLYILAYFYEDLAIW